MWYEWIVSNYNDPDLIPENVRDQIDIFGVPGNLVPTFGTLGVWKSQNMYWWVETMPQYMVAINIYANLNGNNFFVNDWNNIYIGIWYHWIVPSQYNSVMVFWIDISTWVCTYLLWADVWTFRLESWKLYLNIWSSHYEITTATWALSWLIAWNHTTGTVPPTTNIVVGWKTYSIQTPIDWHWLRTANSWNDNINWTWIVIS